MPYVQYPKPRPQLSRQEASRLLQLVIARAVKINGDPARYPYAVSRLVLFGSYLTDKEVLGDLDIGAELRLVRRMDDLNQERPGWRPVHWAELTYVALRIRKPNLVSIHDILEVRNLDTATEQVFEDPAVAKRAQALRAAAESQVSLLRRR